VASSTPSRSATTTESALARTGAAIEAPVGLAMIAVGLGGLMVLYAPRRG